MGNGKSGGPNIFRILAGGYVIYLAIQILSSVAKGEAEDSPVFLVIAAVVFIVLGAGLIIYTLRDMQRLKKEEAEIAEEPQDEPAEEVVEVTEEPEKESSEELIEKVEDKETAEE